MKKEYVAVKIKGINHWFWFKVENVQRDSYEFQGTAGWGKDGAFTNLKVKIDQIEGEITSDTPQYR